MAQFLIDDFIMTFFTESRLKPIKLLLLGSGELGKELTIEAQRMGLYVIAVDCYADAPAMQIAHQSVVLNMLDVDALSQLITDTQPDLIVPEIEAIATAALLKAEQMGFRVTPSAKAADLTLNRAGIRRLAAEELGIETSDFRFVSDFSALKHAVTEIGYPCVIKPIMSSSGKGQTIVHNEDELEDRKSTRLNSSHVRISYAVFCL